MNNIDAQSLTNQEIEITKTNQLFCKPDKWDLKAFRKAILQDFQTDESVETLIVGWYINTDSPHFVIGLQVGCYFESYMYKIRTSLYKQFTKHSRFEFIDLTENKELTALLEKQCEVIIKRNVNVEDRLKKMGAPTAV